MNFAALLLAEVLRLTDPGLVQPMSAVPDTSRYHLTEFVDAIDRGDAFRYRLAEFSHAIDDAFRYRLAESSDAVERDVERCICMTTRLSLATLKSEVLLVRECDCGQ